MAVPDIQKADEYLRRIGYYRLSAYWYPFRRLAQQADGSFVLTDNFKTGTTFKQVTDLYVFDKRLRLLILDAIDRIEVSVRTEVALTIGRHDPKAHRNPAMLDARFSTVYPPHVLSMHAEWINKLNAKEAGSKEEFANHFRSKYAGDQMPIWIAVELLDFGPLSIFLSGMRFGDLQTIASSYGLNRKNGPHLIRSWTRSLSSLRNACAHHARVWNKPLIDQPSLPKQGEITEIDHLVRAIDSNKRLYAALCVMRVLLKRVNPRSNWANRLKNHIATFPTAPNIKLADAGFPVSWQNLPLWN